MKKFSNKSIEELGYYVYALIDPRDGRIFYIGKGCGNRVFQHCMAAIQEEEDSLKLNLIREIIASGEEVGHYILRHKLSEHEAFQIESVLIDFLTYDRFNTSRVLTNIVCGHHQWDEGIKTVNEIEALYNCEKIKINARQPMKSNDSSSSQQRFILLVSLNRSFDDAKAHGVYHRIDIYDKTRRYWAISKQQAPKIDYVLGVYRGIVRAVLKVEGCEWVTCDESQTTKFNKERCCFHGRLENDSPYLNKDVSDYPFGSGGAVRYIPIDTGL